MLAVLGTILILVVLSLLDRVESYARRRFALRPGGYDFGDEASQADTRIETMPSPPKEAGLATPSAHQEPEQSEGELEDLP